LAITEKIIARNSTSSPYVRQLVKGGGDGTFLNLGGFISAIIYFIVFIAVVTSIALAYQTAVGVKLFEILER
jgi:hypothetical protein